jgi:2-amino-4-hydroxy-6-hydroxymethyldihydropteridine diphosphokinase
MVTCYIGIGSNLGDRQYYINTAIRKIMMLINTRVRKISQIIETPAQGGPLQGPYLNGVLEIETEISPYQLLQEFQKIESSLGRVRSVKNAARTIDLDILTYGELRIDETALCIPHPRLLEREFVFKPLSEIAPGVIKKIEKHLSIKGKPKKAAAKKTGKKKLRSKKK